MKKNKLILLCLMALMTTGTMKATDSYIIVSGIEVTEENKDDILNDGGRVKYNYSTRTLTLNNATINGVGDYAEALKFPEHTEDYAITIKLIGNNICAGQILLLDDVIIDGPGSLKILNKGILVCWNGNLTIKNCNIESLNGSISGGQGCTGTNYLTIDNANVKVKTGFNGWGSMHYFSGINLINCYIATPQNATINYGGIYVAGEPDPYTGLIEIRSTSSGVDVIDQAHKAKIYPNPVKDLLNIISDIAIEHISIYNTSGALVAEVSGTDNIDISDLLPAIYIVKIETAKGIQVERIVKE